MSQEQIDILNSAAGLAKSHSVTTDSETTSMRTGKDMQDVANFIGNQQSCANRTKVMASVFMFRGKPNHFRGLR